MSDYPLEISRAACHLAAIALVGLLGGCEAPSDLVKTPELYPCKTANRPLLGETCAWTSADLCVCSSELPPCETSSVNLLGETCAWTEFPRCESSGALTVALGYCAWSY